MNVKDRAVSVKDQSKKSERGHLYGSILKDDLFREDNILQLIDPRGVVP